MKQESQKQEQKPSERKLYSKPDLRRIQLKPEESLAGACKLADAGATGASQCYLDTCFYSGS